MFLMSYNFLKKIKLQRIMKKCILLKVFSRMVSTPSLPILTTMLVIMTVTITTWQINKSTSVNVNIRQPALEANQIYMHVPKRREDTQISYGANSLPSWDFTRLINLPDFTFLLENSVCNETKPLDLLVVIHTAPKNIERRNAIRDTWGQPREGMRVLFMLGGVDNQSIQDKFDAEDRKYHDLVQGNFAEAYKNLTYKHIMSFKYTVYYCPTVKYVLKTDDDLFVNIPLVMDFLKTLPPEGKKDYVLCSIMDGSPAIRSPSKWFVPFKEYPHSSYPIYCSGFAVIYSYDVVFRLYREAQRGEYFWVDDAFVSGKESLSLLLCSLKLTCIK